METIAVYWEPKIRIYGLNTETGLSLYTLIFPVDRLSYWGGVVRSIGEEGREFTLVNLQKASATAMQLCLLPAAGSGSTDVGRWLEKGLESEAATSLRVVTPVELIYLHGPHFQDRYGIAEAAVRPLHNAVIPILSAGCAGTSVYLVVPENRANEAAACLSETFVL
jgi:aspartokinase